MITEDIQSLSPGAIIELFVLDTSSLPDGALNYFHAGTNELRQAVVWQGNTYNPVPIEASGFDITTKGTLPRPKIKVANVNGLFSAIALETDDLIGCKITRKRTFAKYLDAVNFTGGVNPTADPNQYLPDDVWFVEQKTSENRYVVEWELSSAFDLQGIMLPYRQVIQDSCPWRYRGAECGYTGTNYFDLQDQPTTLSNDFCAKRLSSCKARFGNEQLPFGGFPGAVRYAG
jgi:lambda family phage minor tail protein L